MTFFSCFCYEYEFTIIFNSPNFVVINYRKVIHIYQGEDWFYVPEAAKPAIRRYKVSLPAMLPLIFFPVSMSSPAHTKHLVESPVALLLRLTCAYATQEQLRAHSAAHSSMLLFRTCTNPSGTFMAGNAKKPSPQCKASFRRHPSKNLLLFHSPMFAGWKPSRHLQVGTTSELSQ